MSTPPPIPPRMPPPVYQSSPPADSFAKQAALFSVLAPFVSFGIGIFGQAAVQGNRWGTLILGCVSTFLILAGLLLGIVALIGMKKHGRKGILGKAVAGVCINGFLVLGMLLAIPMFIKIANQAKAAQAQQQMEQQH